MHHVQYGASAFARQGNRILDPDGEDWRVRELDLRAAVGRRKSSICRRHLAGSGEGMGTEERLSGR